MRDELCGLSSSIKEFSGRIKRISWITRTFINSETDGDPSNIKFNKRYDLWDKSVANYVFSGPFNSNGGNDFTDKLDSLVILLDDLVDEANIYIENNPGLRCAFDRPPSDLDIFHSCAILLIKRGCSLNHLRIIAEMVYKIVTGVPPKDYWGRRQEEDARRRLKHTPQ